MRGSRALSAQGRRGRGRGHEAQLPEPILLDRQLPSKACDGTCEGSSSGSSSVMGLVPRHLSPTHPQVPDSQRAGRWQHSRHVCGSGSGPGGALITGVGTCPGAARGPPRAGLARAAPACSAPSCTGVLRLSHWGTLNWMHFVHSLPCYRSLCFMCCSLLGLRSPTCCCGGRGVATEVRRVPAGSGPTRTLAPPLEVASSQGDHSPSPACRLLVLPVCFLARLRICWR